MMRLLILLFVFLLFGPGFSQATDNSDGVAVIIGNRTYQHSIPAVTYAHRDADAIRHYVIDVLGFSADNIIDLRDATKAEMEAAFGNERDFKGKLWSYLDPRGGSDIVVYYSGHGVPGQNDHRGYLLPVNADPDQAEINGYPADLLYANLGKLNARSKTVLIDACFSGDSAKGMLVRSASPVFIEPKVSSVDSDVTVLTAAGGAELASWDDDAQHGLFTEYFLRAVYGDADLDHSGTVTASEVKDFLDDKMTRAARRTYRRQQTASLIGDRGKLLSVFPANTPPARPDLPSLNIGTDTPDGNAETVFWQSIRDSDRPEEFKAYLQTYPNGVFAPLATARLNALSKGSAPTVSRSPSPAYEDFSGTWDTSYGKMVLTQSGKHVTGNYESGGGTVDGVVNGGKLTGTWREFLLIFPRSGPFEFTMSSDGQTFYGRWRDSGATTWTENWHGTRR